MKKKIYSKIMVLSFAFAALILIGNNLAANDVVTPIINPPGFSCSVEAICSDGGKIKCTGIESCSRKSGTYVSCDGNTIWC